MHFVLVVVSLFIHIHFLYSRLLVSQLPEINDSWDKVEELYARLLKLHRQLHQYNRNILQFKNRSMNEWIRKSFDFAFGFLNLDVNGYTWKCIAIYKTLSDCVPFKKNYFTRELFHFILHKIHFKAREEWDFFFLSHHFFSCSRLLCISQFPCDVREMFFIHRESQRVKMKWTTKSWTYGLVWIVKSWVSERRWKLIPFFLHLIKIRQRWCGEFFFFFSISSFHSCSHLHFVPCHCTQLPRLQSSGSLEYEVELIHVSLMLLSCFIQFVHSTHAEVTLKDFKLVQLSAMWK